MVLDAALQPSLGGWQILYFIRGIAHDQWVFGPLQVVLLLGVAGLLAKVRGRRAMSRLGALPAQEVDLQLASMANELSQDLCSRPINFLVTKNVFDANAFCLASLSSPIIILGGGLRLMLRKFKSRARAIVAHECAHIANGDTALLFISWNLFLSYVGWSLFGFLAYQILIWKSVIGGFGPWQDAGYGFFDFVSRNYALGQLASGWPAILSVLGLALAFVHFIKSREFYADERASHHGFRSELLVLLEQSRQSPESVWLRLIGRFHPTAMERAQRLGDEASWARANWLFLFAIALVAVRLESIIPSIPLGIQVIDPDSWETLVPTVYQNFVRAGPAVVLSMSIDIAVAFILTLHAFRVIATISKLGGTLIERWLATMPLMLALFAGTFIGNLTAWSTLHSLGLKEGGPTIWLWLDWSLLSAGHAMHTGFWLTLCLALVVGPFQRLAPRRPVIESIRLCVVTVTVVPIAMIFPNSILATGYLLFGLKFPAFYLAKFPMSSSHWFPGAPNMIQLALIISGIAMGCWLTRKVLGQTREAPSQVRVHSLRIVES